MTHSLSEAQQALITPEIIAYADQLARRWQGRGLELDDLKQEARYGVCLAALHYNPQAGASMKTFCTFYVWKQIIRALHDYGHLIRLTKDDLRALALDSLDVDMTPRTTGLVVSSLDRPLAGPLAGPLAEALSTDDGAADYLLSRQDDPDENSPREMPLSAAEAVVDEDTLEPSPSPEEQVAELMQGLSPKERRAIELLFGLTGPSLTVKETSRILQVTPERVRQMANRAMAKMALSNL